jgi:hypothetical protein
MATPKTTIPLPALLVEFEARCAWLQEEMRDQLCALGMSPRAAAEAVAAERAELRADLCHQAQEHGLLPHLAVLLVYLPRLERMFGPDFSALTIEQMLAVLKIKRDAPATTLETAIAAVRAGGLQ